MWLGWLWSLARGAPWFTAPAPVLYPGFSVAQEPAPIQLDVTVWKQQRRVRSSPSAAILGLAGLEEDLERVYGAELQLLHRERGQVNTGGAWRWDLPDGGSAHAQVLELLAHRALVSVGLVRGTGRSEWTQEVPYGREVLIGGRADLLLSLEARW